jgi:putative ABC transport system substrate-binding protein
MNRRRFIALISSSTAVVLPPRGYTQPAKKAYRVAFVGANGPQAPMRELSITKAFMEGMRDLGYFEGENIQYVLRSTEGKITERTGPMVAEFIAMGVDVVLVASGALAKEMMRYTSSMPIVMAVSPDPVADGIVYSLARPGGNVTGFSLQAGPELEAKRLQLLKEIAPTMVRVAYLATKKEWDDVDGKALQIAAQKLGMTPYLVENSLTNSTEAFRSLESEPPDALVVSHWTSNWVRRQSIFDFVHHRRVPVTYPWREYVDAGGLMSYGVNLADQYRSTANYVDKIIKGANPGELPIQLPTKFELVISLKAAKAIGLEIPSPVLAQAAEVIE